MFVAKHESLDAFGHCAHVDRHIERDALQLTISSRDFRRSNVIAPSVPSSRAIVGSCFWNSIVALSASGAVVLLWIAVWCYLRVG